MSFAKVIAGFGGRVGGAMIAAVAILAAVSSGPVRGAVVLGNLGASGTNAILSSSFSPGEIPFAFGFVAGTDPSFLELTSASFGLSMSGTSGFAKAELYDDAGGVPGAPLQLIGGPQSVAINPTPNPPSSAVTFTAASPIPLVSGSTYWIVLSSTDAALRWHQPYGGVQAQNGSTWSGGSGKQFNGTSWVNTFRIGAVSISAVPEPTTTMLLAGAASVGGVAVLRRHRRGRLPE